MTKEERRLINMMYDKKGNLTPIGKKVMEHRIKEKETDQLMIGNDSFTSLPIDGSQNYKQRNGKEN